MQFPMNIFSYIASTKESQPLKGMQLINSHLRQDSNISRSRSFMILLGICDDYVDLFTVISESRE